MSILRLISKPHDHWPNAHPVRHCLDDSVRTIVVIHPGSLGDALLAVPAMRRLRDNYPHHRLCLCANEAVSRLLVACGEADQCLAYGAVECQLLFSDSGSGILREWLARCDVAVAWLSDLEGRIAAALKQHGARKTHVGSPFSASLTAVHQRDRFLEVLEEEKLDPTKVPCLVPPLQMRERGKALLRQAGVPPEAAAVLIHPGSGSAQKCVAPAILSAVMDGLRSVGAMPVVLEGPADRPFVDGLLQQADSVPSVVRDLDVIGLASLLMETRLLLGHDSGVSHLSALLGVPTVALFGPTDPGRWAPTGPHVHVMRGNPCSCPDWDRVRRCEGKPCLSFSAQSILSLCVNQLA